MWSSWKAQNNFFYLGHKVWLVIWVSAMCNTSTVTYGQLWCGFLHHGLSHAVGPHADVIKSEKLHAVVYYIRLFYYKEP